MKQAARLRKIKSKVKNATGNRRAGIIRRPLWQRRSKASPVKWEHTLAVGRYYRLLSRAIRCPATPLRPVLPYSPTKELRIRLWPPLHTLLIRLTLNFKNQPESRLSSPSCSSHHRVCSSNAGRQLDRYGRHPINHLACSACCPVPTCARAAMPTFSKNACDDGDAKALWQSHCPAGVFASPAAFRVRVFSLRDSR